MLGPVEASAEAEWVPGWGHEADSGFWLPGLYDLK